MIPAITARMPRTIRDVVSDLNMTAFLRSLRRPGHPSASLLAAGIGSIYPLKQPGTGIRYQMTGLFGYITAFLGVSIVNFAEGIRATSSSG
jgi:hypothetical protein